MAGGGAWSDAAPGLTSSQKRPERNLLWKLHRKFIPCRTLIGWRQAAPRVHWALNQCTIPIPSRGPRHLPQKDCTGPA